MNANFKKVNKLVLASSVCIVFQLFFSSDILANRTQSLSQDIPTAYYIEAELDTVSKTLTGRESVEFYNPTSEKLDVFIFHLYPNAFRDTLTTMAKSNKRLKEGIAHNPGYIDCDSIMIDGQTPDSIKLAETLLYIYPKQKLPPGDVCLIEMNFELKIPSMMLRYGYDASGNYLLAHWHPILAGYQKNKAVVFDYSVDGEFFSNFSFYDVSLILPQSFLLASTAEINEPDSTPAGKSYYSLHAERVIDFAFACGPAWQKKSIVHDSTEINILYRPSNESKLDDLTKNITGSLDYFRDRLFKYPAKSISYVDINPGANGMELPCMVAMSFENERFSSNRGLAMTAIHETAHQWFYAVIATNEFDEAWLDEGFVSYSTDRAMEAIYGRARMIDFYGIEVSFTDISALSVRMARSLTPVAWPSDQFYDNDYFINVYGRAAAVIRTLEGVLGTEVFNQALKEYAETYKYKHPDSHDLQAIFERSSGQNLDWFFDSYIFGTSRVDYEVSLIKTGKNNDVYSNTVEVQRNYEGVLPQHVRVAFSDGSDTLLYWDGLEKYQTFEFTSNSSAVWAAIDTGYFYLIDEDFTNNSLRIQPETGMISSFSATTGFLVQMFLMILGVL
jgi:hypothetical protein